MTTMAKKNERDNGNFFGMDVAMLASELVVVVKPFL
jgi:hypothetical protein